MTRALDVSGKDQHLKQMPLSPHGPKRANVSCGTSRATAPIYPDDLSLRTPVSIHARVFAKINLLTQQPGVSQPTRHA